MRRAHILLGLICLLTLLLLSACATAPNMNTSIDSFEEDTDVNKILTACEVGPEGCSLCLEDYDGDGYCDD